jgi:hypothetical protein
MLKKLIHTTMQQVHTSGNTDKTTTKMRKDGMVITIAHTYELDVQMKKEGFLYDIIKVLLLDKYQVNMLHHRIKDIEA